PTVVYSHTPRCLSRARRAPPCPYPTLFRSMLPDRDHLHHIFMRAGFSERQALAIITLVAVVLAAVGLAGEFLQVPEWVMCVGILLVFAAYNLALAHVWRLTGVLRRSVPS